ncbi:MAG: hypothetical protein AB7F35_18580 [Acetobacteraceae bacterium]
MTRETTQQRAQRRAMGIVSFDDYDLTPQQLDALAEVIWWLAPDPQSAARTADRLEAILHRIDRVRRDDDPRLIAMALAVSFRIAARGWLHRLRMMSEDTATPERRYGRKPRNRARGKAIMDAIAALGRCGFITTTGPAGHAIATLEAQGITITVRRADRRPGPPGKAEPVTAEIRTQLPEPAALHFPDVDAAISFTRALTGQMAA